MTCLFLGEAYDAKEIALDVFKTNFIQLKQEAAEIARERAEEVTEKIISKITERNPAAINEFQQPAMQDALFTVQKQYAKTGDKDLGDLLVDILVDRASQPKRNMIQIVLDESLEIAPKLTVEQLDTITINFLMAQTRRLNLRNYADFSQHIVNHICPFVDKLTNEHTYYSHIEYLGCGHVRVGNYGELESILRNTYRVFFSNGFTKEEFESEVGSFHMYQGMIIPCFHNVDKIQFSAYDDEVLEKMVLEKGLDNSDFVKSKAFFEKTTKAANEVKDMIVGIDPRMEKVFKTWTEAPLRSLELTSVGVAIAHANYRRKTGETLDLSIWIK